MITRYFERKRQNKIAEIAEKYPSKVNRIGVVAQNSDMEESLMDDLILDLDRDFFNEGRRIVTTSFLSIFGGIVGGATTLCGVLEDKPYLECLGELILLGTVSVGGYFIKRGVDYFKRQKEYERMLGDAQYNRMSTTRRLFTRH